MALRLIEAAIPKERIDALLEILDEQPVLHYRLSEADQDVRVAHILIDAQNVEALTDTLVDRLGSDDGLRMVLLAVEGTIPVASKEDSEPTTEDGNDEPSRERISREELYESLVEGTRLTPVFCAMVALSAIVAAVGLIRNDVAVIVGAMVIAPLIGPNVALSLACALGDLKLAKRSILTLAVGLLIAGGVATIFGAAVDFDPQAPELEAKTRATLGDIALALAAGAAGSLAFAGGISSVLVGVMVAVALLPPLVAAGLLVGAGMPEPAAGALTLLFANVVCINLAAVATFYLQRVRPRTWREEEQAKRALWVAVPLWTLLLVLLVIVILWADMGTV